MRSPRRLLGLIPVFLLLLAACSTAAPTATTAPKAGATVAQPTTPIKIGVSAAVTGLLNRYTETHMQGIRWAVEEANLQGGVLGRQLELIVLDNKSAVSDSVETYRELVFGRKVDFVLGDISSGGCVAQAEVALEAKVPVFSSCMTDQFTFAKGNRYTFRAHHNTWIQGAAAAELVKAKFPNAKRVYTLASDYEFGRALTERFVQHLKAIKPDAEVVGQSWPALAESDYTAFITAILAAKPDVLLVNLGLTPPFWTQAVPIGLMQKMTVIAPGWDGPNNLVLLKKEQLPLDAWLGGVPWYAIDTPENNLFAQKIREKFVQDPVSTTYMGYINARFVIEGIRKAGSADREKVVDALAGMTLNTALGPITLGSVSHQGRQDYWIGKVSGWDAAKGYGVLGDVTRFSGQTLLPSEDEVKTLRAAAK